MLLESSYLAQELGIWRSTVFGVNGRVWIPCSIDGSLKSGVLSLVQTDGGSFVVCTPFSLVLGPLIEDRFFSLRKVERHMM